MVQKNVVIAIILIILFILIALLIFYIWASHNRVAWFVRKRELDEEEGWWSFLDFILILFLSFAMKRNLFDGWLKEGGNKKFLIGLWDGYTMMNVDVAGRLTMYWPFISGLVRSFWCMSGVPWFGWCRGSLGVYCYVLSVFQFFILLYFFDLTSWRSRRTWASGIIEFWLFDSVGATPIYPPDASSGRNTKWETSWCLAYVDWLDGMCLFFWLSCTVDE